MIFGKDEISWSVGGHVSFSDIWSDFLVVTKDWMTSALTPLNTLSFFLVP
jgi:hypothetical protein